MTCVGHFEVKIWRIQARLRLFCFLSGNFCLFASSTGSRILQSAAIVSLAHGTEGALSCCNNERVCCHGVSPLNHRLRRV